MSQKAFVIFLCSQDTNQFINLISPTFYHKAKSMTNAINYAFINAKNLDIAQAYILPRYETNIFHHIFRY
jgi:hypothetical protein